jgi:hypothetical protein
MLQKTGMDENGIAESERKRNMKMGHLGGNHEL